MIGSSLTHAQFIAYPLASVWWYVDGVRASRSRRGKIGGKISVKCQFAKNIWNFCGKGNVVLLP